MARTVPAFIGIKLSEIDLARLQFAEAMERKGRSEIVRTAIRSYLAQAGIPESVGAPDQSKAA
jgi:hypothetical protein